MVLNNFECKKIYPFVNEICLHDGYDGHRRNLIWPNDFISNT